MEKEIKMDEYMEDAQGRLVHRNNVKEIDKLRDELVRSLVAKAITVQKEMSAFKQDALGEVNAFVDLSAREYDVKLGGKKGNLTLLSYDGKLKAIVHIQENLVFDERLQAAKSLIDECLNKWVQSSTSEIKTIINDAFAVNKEGKIDIKRILSLRKLDIQDELWQKAMSAISDSLTVADRKSHFRVYQRTGLEDAWQNITLDFAAL